MCVGTYVHIWTHVNTMNNSIYIFSTFVFNGNIEYDFQ